MSIEWPGDVSRTGETLTTATLGRADFGQPDPPAESTLHLVNPWVFIEQSDLMYARSNVAHVIGLLPAF